MNIFMCILNTIMRQFYGHQMVAAETLSKKLADTFPESEIVRI
jgi:hypothetical protein